MKKLQKISPLLGAIIAVTGSAAVSAKSYTVNASGNAVSQLTTIQNVPGVPTAPMPALYQAPAMSSVGGAGVPYDMSVTVDGDTGEVTDFKVISTHAGIFSATGTRFDIRPVGRYYTPGAGFGPGACSVTNGANDSDGVLEYDCPTVQNTANFADLTAPGNVCGSTAPTSTAAGANGCGAPWGGFPAGFSAPQIATQPAIVFYGGAAGAGPTFGGQAIDVLGLGTPSVYQTTDHQQNTNSAGVYEFQGKRGGGKFVISHTGTLAGGDFNATAIAYNHNTDITFAMQGGLTGAAQSVTNFSFTPSSQSLTLLASDAKNVPAMGAFGLAALFGGLVAVAARLRRRVS